MCQAYDGERAAIVAEENLATLRGFSAARLGRPRTENPFYERGEKYSYEAWKHGWSCWQERLLPWVLESEYRKLVDIRTAYRVSAEFKQTGKLPEELEKIVERYSN